LVKGGEDPLHLGRAATRRRKPRGVDVMRIEVGGGISRADLRQSGAPGFKPSEQLKRSIQPVRTATVRRRAESVRRITGCARVNSTVDNAAD
jgi:hypothetical protein